MRAWESLTQGVRLRIEDDRGDDRVLSSGLPGLASGCDLLLGPYSSRLSRVAGRVAAESGRLLWNHGGAADDVQGMPAGQVVSVLTPASRYAEPFLRRLRERLPAAPLWIAAGSGRFGRQAAAGAESLARDAGIQVVRLDRPAGPPLADVPATWDLFCAGSFEEDVETITLARGLPRPPRHLCAVAAGVRDLASAVSSPEGIFGVGQWLPGARRTVEVGPPETGFLAAYAKLTGVVPDYPAAQAAAAAALATECARRAGGVQPEALWAEAARLDAATFFGRFRVDPLTGSQLGHSTVLVRWTEGEPVAA